jgi:hypothetical protein
MNLIKGIILFQKIEFSKVLNFNIFDDFIILYFNDQLYNYFNFKTLFFLKNYEINYFFEIRNLIIKKNDKFLNDENNNQKNNELINNNEKNINESINNEKNKNLYKLIISLKERNRIGNEKLKEIKNILNEKVNLINYQEKILLNFKKIQKSQSFEKKKFNIINKNENFNILKSIKSIQNIDINFENENLILNFTLITSIDIFIFLENFYNQNYISKNNIHQINIFYNHPCLQLIIPNFNHFLHYNFFLFEDNTYLYFGNFNFNNFNFKNIYSINNFKNKNSSNDLSINNDLNFNINNNLISNNYLKKNNINLIISNKLKIINFFDNFNLFLKNYFNLMNIQKKNEYEYSFIINDNLFINVKKLYNYVYLDINSFDFKNIFLFLNQLSLKKSFFDFSILNFNYFENLGHFLDNLKKEFLFFDSDENNLEDLIHIQKKTDLVFYSL